MFGVISRGTVSLQTTKLRNELHKLYLKPVVFNLKETKEEKFKVEVIKVLVQLELHPIRVIVCEGVSKAALKTILRAASELGLLSEKYLWIFTERMVNYLPDISRSLLPRRMFGIRLNVTDEVIGRINSSY